jgi:hypothetical protein
MEVIFNLAEIETLGNIALWVIADTGSKGGMGKITHEELNYLQSALLGYTSAG